jgi:16S rRNA processing protein RimM
MTQPDRRILMGRITGAHGIRGDVVIDSYASDPGAIADYGPLTTENRREMAIKVVRATPKGIIARVAGVSDRNGAEALKGTALYVGRERLPDADDGTYYHADLIGLRAEDKAGAQVGTVVAVLNFGAGDILEIGLTGKPQTELIPFEEAFVPTVDVAGGRVVVELPVATGDDDDGGEDDAGEPEPQPG